MGLIDSLYELPPEWVGDIQTRIDYVDSDLQYTSFHGLQIFHILHSAAPEAKYNLYRVTREDTRRKLSDIIEALGDAKKECDIVNLSIGQPKPPHGTRFALCKSAQKVVESGTVIVAAAGNRNRQSTKIRCPAQVGSVISVGALVTECRAEIDSTGETELHATVQPNINPPNSYWIEKGANEEYWEKLTGGAFPTGPFCSGVGCSPHHMCEYNSYTREWERNIDETPDILAPHHYFGRLFDQNGEVVYNLRQGSSFAAPVVAGCLACILGELFEKGKKPDPTEIKRAVCERGGEIDEGPGRKFNAARTYQYLLESV